MKFDESFKSMIQGEWTYLLAKDRDGKFDTHLIGSFINDVSKESGVRTVQDPE